MINYSDLKYESQINDEIGKLLYNRGFDFKSVYYKLKMTSNKEFVLIIKIRHEKKNGNIIEYNYKKNYGGWYYLGSKFFSDKIIENVSEFKNNLDY